jgi:hypothetical protein
MVPKQLLIEIIREDEKPSPLITEPVSINKIICEECKVSLTPNSSTVAILKKDGSIHNYCSKCLNVFPNQIFYYDNYIDFHKRAKIGMIDKILKDWSNWKAKEKPKDEED